MDALRLLPLLPPARFVPGRDEIIDHAGRIDKTAFQVSTGVLFGLAMLCVMSRLAVRIFGKREFRWDDGFVLAAAVTLAAAFGVTTATIDRLYLTEAISRRLVVPFREEIPQVLELTKWATSFDFLTWTSVYMVKFAFQYFFFTLTRSMQRSITILYWSTVGITVVSWLYTVLCTIIVCPHFGADSVKCASNPGQHSRSLINNIIASCLDIITDVLIISLPIVILRLSMMPLARKLSLAAMLCLSIAMIVVALVRLIGTVATTQADSLAAAPTWAWYWAVVESCIALIMTSVIVLRGAFVTTQPANPVGHDGKSQDSLVRRFGRQLRLSLRLDSLSLRPWRRNSSPRRSSNEEPKHGPGSDSDAPPKIATQHLTRASMGDVVGYGNGGYISRSGSQTGLRSVDTTYIMEDLSYHNIRKNEARYESV
ncbi:integral membrane protein [Apiospora marii]|uniref:Integral membrane protein n=1 Tax=Apiospora marii TaxID=335849 RepID=A0ABR1SJA8_9PEZI